MVRRTRVGVVVVGLGRLLDGTHVRVQIGLRSLRETVVLRRELVLRLLLLVVCIAERVVDNILILLLLLLRRVGVVVGRRPSVVGVRLGVGHDLRNEGLLHLLGGVVLRDLVHLEDLHHHIAFVEGVLNNIDDSLSNK